jgi:exodeoxyribonuclease VII large subunit
VNAGIEDPSAESGGRVWAVGPLMRAIADTLSARFNPVAVQGEISGFSRAASGHCYFSLKDDTGQVRCALFRRAADQLSFAPRDGQRVVARGKLDVYGPRGDLQLIVDSLQPAGQGALFEQFLLLKAQLEAEGLFDAARKRPLPTQPRRIGVVTSLGAAALRDVATALRRRVPHIPVLLFPASVQGAQAPAELVAALERAYALHGSGLACDVLLVVRGGGSLEDLWSFNDPAVVRTMARAPVPVVCGVGHETDFTLADFVADLRAPTPTAAAELCAPSLEQRLGELAYAEERLRDAVHQAVDQHGQRLDWLTQRLGRPSTRLHQAALQLDRLQARLKQGVVRSTTLSGQRLEWLAQRLPVALQRDVQARQQRLQRSQIALSLLDPKLVLERGYAWLTDDQGQAITRAAEIGPGQPVRATLADGSADLVAR